MDWLFVGVLVVLACTLAIATTTDSEAGDVFASPRPSSPLVKTALWTLLVVMLISDGASSLRSHFSLEAAGLPRDVRESVQSYGQKSRPVTEMFSASVAADTPPGSIAPLTSSPLGIQMRAPYQGNGEWLVCVYVMVTVTPEAPESLSFYAPLNTHQASYKQTALCPLIHEQANYLRTTESRTLENGLKRYSLDLAYPQRIGGQTQLMQTYALTWTPSLLNEESLARYSIMVSYDSVMPAMFEATQQQSLESYFRDAEAVVPSGGGENVNEVGVEMVVMPDVASGDRVTEGFGTSLNLTLFSAGWKSSTDLRRVDGSVVVENPVERQFVESQLQVSTLLVGIGLFGAVTGLYRSVRGQISGAGMWKPIGAMLFVALAVVVSLRIPPFLRVSELLARAIGIG